MAEYSYGTSEQDIARYRIKAEKCRKEAENSPNPADKEAWLCLAEDWTKMAQEVERRRSQK